MTAPAPDPIGRTALAVEITNRLRQMILEGQLQPGEKINEKRLTELFGVSRTPLREALKVLASEGLLDLVPHRGAVITRQSEAELAEVFRVLAALEGLAGELAAENADQVALDEIAALTGELRQTFEKSDRPTYFRINQAIHNAILAAAGNDTLLRSHELLAFRVQRARYQANLTAERWCAAVEEHEAIAAALCERDAARSAQLMRDHMLKKYASIRAKADN
jgi:DNA-binding GntR family transcriptional regulator